MRAVDVIKMNLEVSRDLTVSLANDLIDAPLTPPTPAGGNHAAWVMGHLAWSEYAVVQQMMLGKDNPLSDWANRFGGGSEPTQDAKDYPPLNELIEKFVEARAETIRFVDTLSDADLSKASAHPPEGKEQIFGTYAGCLMVSGLHPMHHRGQLADARRALSRKPVMA